MNNTQTKHTDLSCHTGSCMAHQNCIPTRVAGINICFFIASPSGGGCWYYAKCKMRYAATQNRMWNEHAKLRIIRKIEMVATCSTTDGNGSSHRLTPSFLKERTCCRHQKHRQRWQGRWKFHNNQNVCLRNQARPLEKHLFAARTPLLWWHCALFFFPTVTCNGFCSQLRKIISRRPWPPPKNRDIHIEEFVFF